MRHHFALLWIASLLAGCTVGPDYAGPPQAAPKALAANGFLRPGDMPRSAEAPAAHWWQGLNDPLLDTLIARAIAANPDVQVARAKLRQARAALGLQRADGAPKVNASALYAHARIPGLDLGSGNDGDSGGNGNSGSDSDLNLYNLGFDASWEIDLFGGQRRAVQAARATQEAAEASIADTQVSLSAEIAQAYVDLRDRQQRIGLSERIIAMQAEIAALTRQRFAGGTATELDVAQSEADLSTSRAQATPLRSERDARLNALAVLTGEEPGALDDLLAAAAPVPMPPAAVAIGQPADLLRRRPDIRAAERRLAAETARIGQSEAARFPRLSFMGLIGIGGTRLDDLGRLDDFAAIAAPQLSWSFLDFGRNKARVEQAKGVRDEAEARYRDTVLGALRNAEDTLSRFRDQRITLAATARSRDIAGRGVTLTAERYRAGTATRIALLDMERRQLDAERTLVSASADLTRDFIAIQKALGLGWDPG